MLLGAIAFCVIPLYTTPHTAFAGRPFSEKVVIVFATALVTCVTEVPVLVAALVAAFVTAFVTALVT